jgi:fatty-acyl-CoA synthase
VFLRLTPSLAVTGTFKPRKLNLVADGFDPGRIPTQVYFHDREAGFVPLGPGLFDRIMSGEQRL